MAMVREKTRGAKRNTTEPYKCMRRRLTNRIPLLIVMEGLKNKRSEEEIIVELNRLGAGKGRRRKHNNQRDGLPGRQRIGSYGDPAVHILRRKTSFQPLHFQQAWTPTYSLLFSQQGKSRISDKIVDIFFQHGILEENGDSKRCRWQQHHALLFQLLQK